MRLLLMTAQVGHYHNARFRAAAAFFPQLTVLSTAGEGKFKEFLAKDTDGYTLETLFQSHREYQSSVAAGRIMRTFEHVLYSLDPEVIGVPGWARPESFAGIRWARRRGARIVLMSESQVHDAARSNFREWVKGRIVSMCDAAFVGGERHRDYIKMLGMPDRYTALGYDSVDNQHYAAGAARARQSDWDYRQRLGLPGRYMLASGRFVAKKNFDALVAAYARVATEFPNLPDLVILGDGEGRPQIEAAIAAGGVAGRVHLPGFRGYDDLPLYYGLAEAFVHVALVEQWGLVVSEAMAAGLPVIVSRFCGVACLVRDGVNGLLVEPQDVDDIATAIRGFLSLPALRRAEMGREAAKTVAEWGPERFGKGLKEAVDAASHRPARGKLPFWDDLLLQGMSRRLIQNVQ